MILRPKSMRLILRHDDTHKVTVYSLLNSDDTTAQHLLKLTSTVQVPTMVKASQKMEEFPVRMRRIVTF